MISMYLLEVTVDFTQASEKLLKRTCSEPRTWVSLINVTNEDKVSYKIDSITVKCKILMPRPPIFTVFQNSFIEKSMLQNNAKKNNLTIKKLRNIEML